MVVPIPREATNSIQTHVPQQGTMVKAPDIIPSIISIAKNINQRAPHAEYITAATNIRIKVTNANITAKTPYKTATMITIERAR